MAKENLKTMLKTKTSTNFTKKNFGDMGLDTMSPPNKLLGHVCKLPFFYKGHTYK